MKRAEVKQKLVTFTLSYLKYRLGYDRRQNIIMESPARGEELHKMCAERDATYNKLEKALKGMTICCGFLDKKKEQA